METHRHDRCCQDLIDFPRPGWSVSISMISAVRHTLNGRSYPVYRKLRRQAVQRLASVTRFVIEGVNGSDNLLYQCEVFQQCHSPSPSSAGRECGSGGKHFARRRTAGDPIRGSQNHTEVSQTNSGITLPRKEFMRPIGNRIDKKRRPTGTPTIAHTTTRPPRAIRSNTQIDATLPNAYAAPPTAKNSHGSS